MEAVKYIDFSTNPVNFRPVLRIGLLTFLFIQGNDISHNRKNQPFLFSDVQYNKLNIKYKEKQHKTQRNISIGDSLRLELSLWKCLYLYITRDKLTICTYSPLNDRTHYHRCCTYFIAGDLFKQRWYSLIGNIWMTTVLCKISFENLWLMFSLLLLLKK